MIQECVVLPLKTTTTPVLPFTIIEGDNMRFVQERGTNKTEKRARHVTSILVAYPFI